MDCFIANKLNFGYENFSNLSSLKQNENVTIHAYINLKCVSTLEILKNPCGCYKSQKRTFSELPVCWYGMSATNQRVIAHWLFLTF